MSGLVQTARRDLLIMKSCWRTAEETTAQTRLTAIFNEETEDEEEEGGRVEDGKVRAC